MGNSIIARAEHRAYIEIKRMRLKNHNPTIISNNCIGGYMSHDLGIRFNSPCVNQGMIAKDYISFLKNMEYYLSLTPVNLNRNYRNTDFMMTQLGDLICLFAHEKSVEVAIEKWEKRKGRINFDNMFVFMVDSFECTYDDIKEFNNLPYKNKVILTHKPYPEFECAHYIKGFEKYGQVGVLSDWKPGFWKRRYLDDFNYVSFLNRKGIR